MNLQMDAYMSPVQAQKLDPKLIMANTILQMSKIDLQQKIELELEENPALEIEETIEKTCPFCKSKIKESKCQICGNRDSDFNNDIISEELIKIDDEFRRIEYISRKIRDKYEEDDDFIWEKISYHQNIREYLTFYLPMVISDKEEYNIGKYLINYINDDGYLKYDTGDIIEKFNISHDRIEKIVKTIQSIELNGTGARDIKECIYIQLKNTQKEVPPIVWELLSDKYWNDFTHRRFTIISESLQITIEEARRAADFIKEHVNPYPGRNFNKSQIKTSGIKPDVIIKKNDDNIVVEIVDEDYKKVKINKVYKDIYNDIKKNKSEYSDNEIEHIKNYFYRTKNFIDNIYQRHSTILRVTEKIVEIQHDFFFKGISSLKPLTRIKVADALGLHDSTISRATNNKYVQLPGGKIVTFDLFFDSSLPVKEEIQKILSAEKKDNILSDNDIVKLLKEKGINIARRTVTKYREDMNIPSSRDRRYE